MPRSRTASFVPGRSSASNDATLTVTCLSASRASSAPLVMTTSGTLDDAAPPSAPSGLPTVAGSAALPDLRPRNRSAIALTLSAGPPFTATTRSPSTCTGPRIPNATPSGIRTSLTVSRGGWPGAPATMTSLRTMAPKPPWPLPIVTGRPSRSVARPAITRAASAPPTSM